MLEEVFGFDWDVGNFGKGQRHGVAIEEIEQAFRREPRVAPDIRHSEAESRFVALAENDDGRPVFIVFTLRTRDGRRLIRPISARYMREKEAVRLAKGS